MFLSYVLMDKEKEESVKNKKTKSKKTRSRRTDEEKEKIVERLVVMDDAMFEAMCQSPDFVQELLQVVLNEPKLRIKPKSLVAQKSVKNLRGRSIRMDAYVEGENDRVFNIEVQKADDCNHVKRVRYNASLITAHNSEPGDSFDDVQTLCMIYLSKKDIFGKGRTVYHVQNMIKETKDVVDNGLIEIYVNAEVNDGSNISALMGVFQKKELDDRDRDKFPKTYEKFNNLKHDKEEVSKMCELIEKYARDHAEEYAKEYAIRSTIKSLDDANVARKKIIRIVIKQFSITKEDAESYYNAFSEK